MQLTPQLLEALGAAHGDAFYLLDSARFRDNFLELLAAFTRIYPNTRIAYSYKTNYTPLLCRLVDRLGGSAEVVSEMEYALATRLGVRGKDIYCNGPYKQERFLREALLNGAHVNVDSLQELHTIMGLARHFPEQIFSLGLRCNFDIGSDKTSRFGLDCEGEEFSTALALLNAAKNLRLGGLHCHFPYRDLTSFRARARGMKALIRRLCLPDLRYVSFGGGYFGRIPPALAAAMDAAPPSFPEYAAILATTMLEQFGPAADVQLIIEPGSALVADAMWLVARVVSTKCVRGRHIATLAASTFNINPSAKGVQRPIEIVSPCAQDVVADTAARDDALWDLVGYTCIEDDCLYVGYKGPLHVGDFVVFSNVGSYSVVFKPPFILPNIPVLDISGSNPVSVKRQETFDDVFQSFSFKEIPHETGI